MSCEELQHQLDELVIQFEQNRNLFLEDDGIIEKAEQDLLDAITQRIAAVRVHLLALRLVCSDDGDNAPPTNEEFEVKIELPEGVDEATVKRIAKRVLKLIEEELGKPATKQRIINELGRGKLSPSGGVDPYSELDAEEEVAWDVRRDITHDVVWRRLWMDQKAIDWDTAAAVADYVTAVVRQSFDRKRDELEKTVPRRRFERLRYERKRIDQEISRLTAKINVLELVIEEKKQLLAKLSETDTRTPDEINEPPHPPWKKMEELKRQIKEHNEEITYSRNIAEKDLPKKARELDKEIAKGKKWYE
jgi:hypothetical protein